MESCRSHQSHRYTRQAFKNDLMGWLLVLPLLVGLVGFTLYPMIKSFSDSFYDYDGGLIRTAVGWDNYVQAFHDPLLGQSLKVTFLYCIAEIPLTMLISLVIALLLQNNIKGVGFFRVIFYLPILIPATVFGMIAGQYYDPDYGLANKLLALFGTSSPFFNSSASSLWTFIVLGFWGIGSNLLLWIAALNNVSRSFLEAAKIEGAGYFRTLFSIVLPICAPYIFFMFLTGMIGGLQTFSMAYILSSGGGADNSLLFIDIYIYQLSMGGGGRFGYASAIAWLLFVITAAFAAAMFVVAKKIYYEDERAK
jgi:multiple sugar transport system permease protein